MMIYNRNFNQIMMFFYIPKLFSTTGGCNIGHPPETHLKPTSRDISSANNLLLICQIILAFFTEHCYVTTMLCAHFQNDLRIAMGVLDERIITSFE